MSCTLSLNVRCILNCLQTLSQRPNHVSLFRLQMEVEFIMKCLDDNSDGVLSLDEFVDLVREVCARSINATTFP